MSNGIDILEPRKRPAPQQPAPPEPEPSEDAGSEALSEALRSSFAIVRVVLVVMVVVFLASGFFTVGVQEKAIILRLGKPVGKDEKALLGPGPHWAFPYPIDEVVRIPVTQVQTIESTVGWYARTAAMEAAGMQPEATDALNPALHGYALTGDGNIVHVKGQLRYRIAEPGLTYMFDFADASNMVLNAFNNAIAYAAASYSVDNVLTRDEAGFRERVRARLENLISQYKLGITADQITLERVPPLKLRPSFDAVSEAEARRAKEVTLARSDANEAINRAKGEAAIRIAAGETDRTRMVEFVAAEATRFKGLLPEYQKNPALFRSLRVAETFQRIFANAENKFMMPEGIQRRITVGPQPEAVKPVEPARAPGH
jgi:membrane protease subunit HflK